MRCLGPKCNVEIAPQRVRRGLAKRFCSDRCRKAFSRVVAGDFAAGVASREREAKGQISHKKREEAPSPPGEKTSKTKSELPTLNTMAAYRAAEAAGGVRASAYKLWYSIHWSTRYLLAEGYDVLALRQDETALLERAARGLPVENAQIEPVLGRAERLAMRLAFQRLKHFPRIRKP
jgi:hypothetical protein